MANKLRKLSSVVQNSSQLGHLKRMAGQQQLLLQQIRQLLPEPLRNHCLHARLIGTRIVLHTTTSVWSSRLRFHAPQILEELKTQAPNLEKLDVRILMNEKSRQPLKLLDSNSGKNQKMRYRLGDSINDPVIKAALKLRRNTNKS